MVNRHLERGVKPLGNVERKRIRSRDSSGLSNTWGFWGWSIAFIVMFIPMLAVPTKGLLGFLIIVGIATVGLLTEEKSRLTLRSLRIGIARNKLLVVMALWYCCGAIVVQLERGAGMEDWRIMSDPIMLLLGLIFALTFFYEEVSFRNFRVFFLLALGLQGFFSFQTLSENVAIARFMWEETRGAWIHGNQVYYAAIVVLLPMLIWTALRERNTLRWLLMASLILSSVTSLLSSFATPLFLFGVMLISVCLLSLLMLVKRKNVFTTIAMVLVAITSGFYVLESLQNNPLLAPAYSRMDNIVKDPESGGYEGYYRKGSRWYLAEISFSTFVESPLFGKGPGTTRNPYLGGHSSFVDNLGAYGLLGGGGALVCFVLLLLIHSIRRYLEEQNWESLLALSSTISFVIAGMINPFWGGATLYILYLSRPFAGMRSADNLLSSFQHDRSTRIGKRNYSIENRDITKFRRSTA